MKVTLLMALTVDGKSARHASHFPDWTETADKKMFREITSKAGVIIMGSNTFDAIGKPLPGRKNIVMTRNPDRTSTVDNLVFTGHPPRRILSDLAAEGFERVVLIGGAKINSLFVREGLIHEMILTFCPKAFGLGISLFSIEISMDLQLKDVQKIGENSIMATYAVVPPAA